MLLPILLQNCSSSRYLHQLRTGQDSFSSRRTPSCRYAGNHKTLAGAISSVLLILKQVPALPQGMTVAVPLDQLLRAQVWEQLLLPALDLEGMTLLAQACSQLRDLIRAAPQAAWRPAAARTFPGTHPLASSPDCGWSEATRYLGVRHAGKAIAAGQTWQVSTSLTRLKLVCLC